jgi:hypothetical protein
MCSSGALEKHGAQACGARPDAALNLTAFGSGTPVMPLASSTNYDNGQAARLTGSVPADTLTEALVEPIGQVRTRRLPA